MAKPTKAARRRAALKGWRNRKTNPAKRKKSTAKRVTSALKKFLKGQKNPAGKAVRLKNFTGTVLRTPRGQVIIRGRGKR